ncbi:DMT family transporter [Sapientia aquatica]|uniref:EamA family transporter n=1 Tax=Sapientia aquatica TaxID=1549640 RepID=A0A4R5VV17_9BURK|nr:EamA family transporter [Sapientia aquatica]TDK61951.1 EamA family transporter [Sapientia aquatica]
MATKISSGGKPNGVWLADLMLFAVAIVWGTSYGVTKGVVAFYPVLGFLSVRFILTFVLLLPVWKNSQSTQIKETVQIGVPLGLVLLSVFACETFGVGLTTASNAAFLISMCVVFTPFVEWLVLHVRPSLASCIATLISLIGALILTSGITLSFNLGDALLLAAAMLRAYMVTLTKKRTSGKQINSLALTAVQCGVVGIGCLVLALLTSNGSMPPLPLRNEFWFATIYLVLFCTIFAFFAQNYAVRQTSPTRVHLLMGMEPVFGALFAMYWLGEQLTPFAWLGGLMIVGPSLWATLHKP